MTDSVLDVRWTTSWEAGPALRDLVVERTGREPGPLYHRCPGCGSVEHGVPSFDLPGVWVSVARADGLTLVALGTSGPIGVDVERDHDGAPEWVRKEAVAKAHGTGIVVEHDQVAAGLWVVGLEVPRGYVAAAAGFSPRPVVRATARRTAKR